MVPLVGGVIVIGRDAGPGGIDIDHSTVSRRHIELRRVHPRHPPLCVDLGSRNGTWINGMALADVPRPLAHGDVLRLGEVVMVFEHGLGDPAVATMCSEDAVPGWSAAAASLRASIDRVAVDTAPALLIGDSGVGKESIAREVHLRSGRAGPLVVTNCAALSPSLIESQLFGHERGAFTGAVKPHLGLFRSAEGGSLFLDEVGELPFELQAKLLRAVEQGEVQPLGDAQTHHVDTRAIAATNQPLQQLVADGKFRRDLYARFSLAEIRVPPIRERRADIAMWIDRLYARKVGSDRPGFVLSAEALECVLLHPWPENLRGLDRLVHALVDASPERPITRGELPQWLREPTVPAASTPSVDAASTPPTPRPGIPSADELRAALARHDNNVAAVAREFRRNRRQVYRWLAGYDIDVDR